jgi:hypothetical protein
MNTTKTTAKTDSDATPDVVELLKAMPYEDATRKCRAYLEHCQKIATFRARVLSERKDERIADQHALRAEATATELANRPSRAMMGFGVEENSRLEIRDLVEKQFPIDASTVGAFSPIILNKNYLAVAAERIHGLSLFPHMHKQLDAYEAEDAKFEVLYQQRIAERQDAKDREEFNALKAVASQERKRQAMLAEAKAFGL